MISRCWTARTLGSLVRITLEAWLNIRVVLSNVGRGLEIS
jgi:hypothetical protein